MKSMPDILYILFCLLTLAQYMYGNLEILLNDLKMLEETGHWRYEVEIGVPGQQVEAGLNEVTMETLMRNANWLDKRGGGADMGLMAMGCGCSNLHVDSELVSFVQDAIASAPYQAQP